MPITRVNSVNTYYEVHGRGLPVLFIHGGTGGHLSTLAPSESILPALFKKDNVRVVLYDRRSSGRSEYILYRFTLKDLLEDARALLDYLRINKAVVIGDSMGGPIAINFASDYPGRVIGLALLETGASLLAAKDLGPDGRGLRNAAITAQRARDIGDRALFESRRIQLRHPPPMFPLGPENLKREKLLQKRRDLYMRNIENIDDDQLFTYFTGSTRNIEAYCGIDLTPQLKDLKMPVCIIHGDADVIVHHSYAADLKKGIPHAELHRIRGAGHGILLYRAPARILREWVLKLA